MAQSQSLLYSLAFLIFDTLYFLIFRQLAVSYFCKCKVKFVFLSLFQSNDPVIDIENDHLILEHDQTLQEAGVSK